MPDMGNLQRWDGFDAAVYKLTQVRRGEAWRRRTSPACWQKAVGLRLYACVLPVPGGDIFEGMDLDERFIQAEVERRFVRLFRESWRAECC
jgi:hypothetical protein